MFPRIALTLVALVGSLLARAADPPLFSLPPGEHIERVVTAAELPGETRDWALNDLNMPTAWKSTEGRGIVVAVLDTGVMSTHRDLRDQIIFKKDFTGSSSGTEDRNGHGAWCAGAIAAADNGWGMIGAAPKAKLWIGKVLGDSGSGSVVGIAAGIRAASDWVGPNGERVAVISMSLGGPGRDSYLPPAIEYARSKGVILVAAAGNDGPGENTVGFPGGYPGVICVAAHDRNGVTANFSSRGAAVFVSGPGVATRAPYPGPGDGSFATISGTSMATPHIAAAVALCVAAHPEIPLLERPMRIPELFRVACSHPASRSTRDGYGKPDAAKLVEGVSPEPPKPITVTLTEADLLPATVARLKAAGIESFSLAVSGRLSTTRLKPTGWNYETVYERTQAGERVLIAVGLEPPPGFVRLIGEAPAAPPGLYRSVRDGTQMRWHPEPPADQRVILPVFALPDPAGRNCPGSGCPRR